MTLPPAWSGPFHHPDTCDLTHLPLPGKFKNMFREKRWCYAGIVSPDLFFGAAVVHLGYVTSAFCFGFDRTTGKMLEHSLVRPPGSHTRYDRNPGTGTCHFKTRGKYIEISGAPDQTRKKLKVELTFPGHTIEADLDILAPPSGLDPMHLPMDMGDGKTAFTAKAAGLLARGQVRLDNKDFTLPRDNSFALFDWTHGAYPRQTFWNWACGAGTAVDKDNTKINIGFNFSRGVYENGRLENYVWINGQPQPIGEMEYSYDPDNPMAPWQIQTLDNRINLTFTPEGMRKANDNFWIVASKFIQPCGKFEGEITTQDGQVLTLETVGGVVEEHYAKW